MLNVRTPWVLSSGPNYYEISFEATNNIKHLQVFMYDTTEIQGKSVYIKFSHLRQL